jgi:hypothetical protein
MLRHYLFIIAIAFMGVPINGQADVGPKPNFEIFFDNSFAPDDKPELLACEKSTCEDQTRFKEMGPQRFDCTSPHVKESHSCFVMAYGFSPYLRLRIQTKDEVYESEPFSPGGDIDATLKNGQLVLNKRLLSKIFCWWCWL